MRPRLGAAACCRSTTARVAAGYRPPSGSGFLHRLGLLSPLLSDLFKSAEIYQQAVHTLNRDSDILRKQSGEDKEVPDRSPWLSWNSSFCWLRWPGGPRVSAGRRRRQSGHAATCRSAAADATQICCPARCCATAASPIAHRTHACAQAGPARPALRMTVPSHRVGCTPPRSHSSSQVSGGPHSDTMPTRPSAQLVCTLCWVVGPAYSPRMNAVCLCISPPSLVPPSPHLQSHGTTPSIPFRTA